MKTSSRFWLKDAEFTFFIAFLAIGIILILQPAFFSESPEIPIPIIGFLMAIVQGICSLMHSVQSLQNISLLIIFGNTRTHSLRGLHIVLLTLLLQLELIQIILYFMPFINKDIQVIAIYYTPVIFLAGHGIAFFISWLQTKYLKLYKVLFTTLCFIIGGVMGFTGAALSDLLSDVNHTVLRDILGGNTAIFSILIAVILYLIGSISHYKNVRHMDVTL